MPYPELCRAGLGPSLGSSSAGSWGAFQPLGMDKFPLPCAVREPRGTVVPTQAELLWIFGPHLLCSVLATLSESLLFSDGHTGILLLIGHIFPSANQGYFTKVPNFTPRIHFCLYFFSQSLHPFSSFPSISSSHHCSPAVLPRPLLPDRFSELLMNPDAFLRASGLRHPLGFFSMLWLSWGKKKQFPFA